MKGKRFQRIVTAALAGLMILGCATTAFAREKLDKISDTWWENKKACWEEVDEASKYEVTLYRNGSSVTTVKTTKTEYNFAAKFTKAGDYKFRVRALAKGSQYSDGAWSSYSEGYTIDSSEVSTEYNSSKDKSDGTTNGTENLGPGGANAGKWVQSGDKWWYSNPDGSYPYNSWKLISEKWYFFDSDGYMKTGWIEWNGQTYYCGSDGAMVTDTDVEGYHLDGSGVRQ